MNNKPIILTGTTGFLGQYALYKLFATGYTNVFLHIRPKKNKLPLERLNHILSNKLFDSTREIILANVTLFNDINTLNVSDAIIIHSAASVDFSASLRDNMTTNYGFTKELLKSNCYSKFIYLSTAYVMPPNTSTVLDPTLSNSILNHDEIFTKSISGEITFDEIRRYHFNTYTLSKEITENLVYDYSTQYPEISFSIMRPSIISVSRSGWNNSLHAGIGTLLLIKSKPVHFINKSPRVDNVPIDDVVEHIIDDFKLNDNFRIQYITNVLANSMTVHKFLSTLRCYRINNHSLWLLSRKYIDSLSLLSCCIPRYIYEKNVYYHDYILPYIENEWNFPNTIKELDMTQYKQLMVDWCDHFIKTKQRNNELGL